MSLVTRGLQRLWGSYEAQLAKSPLTTQIATSTLLWGTGDLISQRIEGKKAWNPKQTAYAAAFGGLLLGPAGHYWYHSLDRIVGNFVTRGSMRFVIAKVAADELMFGPLHVLGFFTFMTKAEGGSWHDVQVKIERDFLSAYLAELAIWPAFQTLNFAKVPVRHQLLFVNAGCLVDATFLCWVKGQDDWLATLGLRKPSTEQKKGSESLVNSNFPEPRKT